MSELPQAESADTDAVQMALQAAHTLWSRGDTSESLRWLKRAAESASDEGSDLRSLQLAKAAAELRAKLFPSASDASPPIPARVPTQRDLSGVRPVSAPEARDVEGAPAPSSTDAKPVTRPEESSPYSSRSPSSAPQYVVHRPREQQRQLMGLSSSTLETARQQNGSYNSVPSWSAGSERRTSSPPPLPHSLDDYEELDAEPIHDSDPQADVAWAGTAAPTWRPAEHASARDGLESMRREAGSDSSPRVATLPPPSFAPSALSSSPPPLPQLSAFGDDDGDPMRPEQPTVLLPPQEEQAPDPAFFAAPSNVLDGAAGIAADDARWAAEPQPSWETGGYSWSTDMSRSGTWAASAAPEATASGSAEQATPAKLTARVHHQAVQVSFAPDARAPGQYVVRVLREGERPLAGERVALLVALEPGVPLV
jgi:hypothetical protein